MSISSTCVRRAALVTAAVPLLLAWAAPAVSAHPLGNFTVNRYDGLTLHQGQLDDLAVVDTAEIPTLQAMPAMDTDHDGRLGPAEVSAHARTACAALAGHITATTNPRDGGAAGASTLRFEVRSSSYRLVRGQAGLDTGRLECRLTAPASLGTAGGLDFSTGVDPARIGWHEITVTGDGVRIGSSDVPGTSTSDALRSYPADLLSNPPDARHAHVVLGSGPGAAVAAAPGTGMLGGWYAALDARLGSLTDRDRLTLPVGLLAVLLALVLGAGHAALPGHGKTIMAAYLAGRQGRPRDAVTVATTVTLTHTGSVLALGAALSASSALVGEQALAWLGTISGLIITAAGIWLLPAALRNLRTRNQAALHHHHQRDQGDDHDRLDVPAHPDGHARAHTHDAGIGMADDHVSTDDLATVAVAAPPALRAGAADHGAGQQEQGMPRQHPGKGHTHPSHPEHGHGHGHGHGDGDGNHGHGHGHGHGHSHGLFGHHHRDSPGRNKGGLIGIGIAGGLVPSPSALVVLLGSIALGRTAFGVLLVMCYGLGMAATLAAAGLFLLTLRDRIPALNGARANHITRWGARVVPLGTALLILAVGTGTALRALPL